LNKHVEEFGEKKKEHSNGSEKTDGNEIRTVWSPPNPAVGNREGGLAIENRGGQDSKVPGKLGLGTGGGVESQKKGGLFATYVVFIIQGALERPEREDSRLCRGRLCGHGGGQAAPVTGGFCRNK